MTHNLPLEAVAAAKARAWATLRPQLIEYLAGACKNHDAFSRASYRGVIPLVADAATKMFSALVEFLPDTDPVEISRHVTATILPVPVEGGPQPMASTTVSGAWDEWLAEAWTAARWQLSGASPCLESEKAPFAQLPALHRNRLVAAVLRTLDDLLPAAKADYFARQARTLAGRDLKGRGPTDANSDTGPANLPVSARRGYRAEIQAWMKNKELRTNEQAARHLGVGVDTLKSIMSNRGKKRYGNDTLNTVLKKIGVLR